MLPGCLTPGQVSNFFEHEEQLINTTTRRACQKQSAYKRLHKTLKDSSRIKFFSFYNQTLQANPVCLSACSVTLLNNVTSVSSSVSVHMPGPQSCHKITWIVCKNAGQTCAPIYPSRHRKTAKTGQSAKQQNSETVVRADLPRAPAEGGRPSCTLLPSP